MIFGMKNRPQPTLFNKKKIYNQKVSFNMILKDTFLLYLLIFYDKGLASITSPLSLSHSLLGEIMKGPLTAPPLLLSKQNNFIANHFSTARFRCKQINADAKD
jgi:hypothetical protein